ncbi:UDP-N-acetylglucosamine--N-acetylmuramyl-(pentapeptide) pyrophosphoryl-undecaprenol N-acetylglucosamine transferase [Ginsengibacter hankyongi]|uniref:UDP-N-acetylglucosamine--N-acetylmuramyl-(Pentapeptide) pyrophosphoryl-undecaprenol N-acetylglucosamine transferase n=1 Tax=Ginsengibacter hankyongi TaxID=2607284 RepID=A0A5J5IME7_9BACT|nr:glycosyltransferase [Ginsengibacter hankyongi]KAA9041921.1 UDP-N-acetylglucosamine--N-acetylmuramyl-(pentapeptide) pyrophosphoryl-undecaprenol N-acetylglucosamine transferase [Ginsengibacter hankyongi]
MINGNNFNSLHYKPKILVTPLDWGLGHATRCIPIINELIYHQCEVIIAASGNGFFLLKKEFPSLVILRINSYKIRYSRRKSLLLFKLAVQVPGIAISIWREKLWLKKTITKYKIDAVISDNRPGMNNKKISSVYITHQLLIKTGNSFFEKIAQKIHYHFIKKFNYCWVPDYKVNGLAGELSHQDNSPLNILYIGPLSRFELSNGMQEKYDILISISGPEPQRTMFEKKILSQLCNFNKKVLLVRGLPNQHQDLKTDNELIKIINHLPAHELNKAFQQSKIIISRSGYTTIMDLVKLGKNAVLVPTPGQTEQEYLSNYLMKKNIFYSVEQDKFSLDKIYNYAPISQPVIMERGMDVYKKVIEEFLLSLKPCSLQTH